MTLRLSVVSEQGTRLGSAGTKVFGVHGGSIGRGSDNEWILPDPERYLSGKHARVDFRAGSYVLVDLSSNGTYVNGAQIPLGKFHDYVLKDGDGLRLGEYEFKVSIEPGNDFPPDAGAIVAYDGRAPLSAVRKSTANDLGADLDLNELLDVPGPATPQNAQSQPVPASEPPAADRNGVPWHMMTRPLRVESKSTGGSAGGAAVAPTPRPQGAAVQDGDPDGLAAFCRGAGIDPRTLAPEARAGALQLAGQLLRECAVGLMDLNQNRDEFCTRFRIPNAAEDGPDSPLNFAGGVEEALVRLLTTQSQRAGSVDAVRHNFRELKSQNVASVTAMRTAFEEFLRRVDPRELAERFDRSAKRNVFGTPNKNKYWEFYGEMFSGLSQRPADGFPHLFTETFAKAYETKLRSLVPPRRTAFGADS